MRGPDSIGDVRILTTVRIQEVLSERTYRAALANGKRVLAFAQPLDKVPALAVGDRCRALLSLCDFEEARLIPDHLEGVMINHTVVDGGGHS